MTSRKRVKLTDLGVVARGRSRCRPRNDASLYGGNYPFVQTADIKDADLYVRHYSQTYNEKGLAQSKLWDSETLCITIAAHIGETAAEPRGGEGDYRDDAGFRAPAGISHAALPQSGKGLAGEGVEVWCGGNSLPGGGECATAALTQMVFPEVLVVRKSVLLRISWLMLLLMAFGGAAAAAEFSADLVQTHGARKLTYKTYIKGRMVREEVNQARGASLAVIVRPDRGVVWVVDSGKKTYRETRGGRSPLTGEAMEQQLKTTATRKYLGKAMVAGYQCDKYLYTFKDRKRGTVTEWFAPKLGFHLPIKMVISRPGRATVGIEYANIKNRVVSQSLFEIPAGYRKVAAVAK